MPAIVVFGLEYLSFMLRYFEDKYTSARRVLPSILVAAAAAYANNNNNNKNNIIYYYFLLLTAHCNWCAV